MRASWIFSKNDVIANIGVIFSGGLHVDGKIKGNVRSAESIELQTKAEIEGEVYYKMIEMALGASVNGSLVRDNGQADKSAVHHIKSVATSGEKE